MITDVLVEDGALYTPIDIYSREGGPKIEVIGMIHIGSPSYYEKVQKRIDQIDFGFYEQIKPSSIEEVKPEKQGYYEGFKEFSKLYDNLARYMGLVGQKDRLNYDADAWRNSDMSLAEYINSLPEKELKRITQSLNPKVLFELEFFHKVHPDECAKLVRETAFFFYRHRFLFKITPYLSSFFTEGGFSLDPYGHSKVTVGLRNDRLFNYVGPELESADSGKLGIVYGAGHLNGVEKFLKSRGYEKARQDRVMAWESREGPSMKESLSAFGNDLKFLKHMEKHAEIPEIFKRK